MIKFAEASKQKLPVLLIVLMVLQPLLDIVSYFWSLGGHSNLPTLMLRMGILAVTALYAFCISQRKRVYLIAAGVCAVFWGAHMAACYQAGYQDPFTDLTNYVRVVQIIVYTLCFITFLREGEAVYRACLIGFCLNLGICAAVMLLSTLTGTDPHTYASGLGTLGWFSTTNAQSAILSASTPVVLMLALRNTGKWRYPLLLAATAISFACLYAIGTRLAYVSILASALGLPVIMALTRQFSLPKTAILFLCAAVCLVGFHHSPMYQNQHIYTDSMAEKQGWASIKIQQAEDSLEQEDSEKSASKAAPESDQAKIKRLTPLYEWCAANITERFGAEAVIRKYNFSSNVQEITAVRQQKIYYCEMLQDELPFSARLFGIELGRMYFKGKIYDVENDFHGIYFLYGIVGLVLLLAFIGYFLLQIVRVLVQDPKTYFTPMAGAIGLSLILLLVYSYCTAGVLRRPNASFYLSMVLALVYYLTRIKVYPPKEERPS